MCVCAYVWAITCEYMCPQSPRQEIPCLELEGMVKHLVWTTRTEPGASGRATEALNWAFLSPHNCFSLIPTISPLCKGVLQDSLAIWLLKCGLFIFRRSSKRGILWSNCKFGLRERRTGSQIFLSQVCSVFKRTLLTRTLSWLVS